jgi:hypothetical protein
MTSIVLELQKDALNSNISIVQLLRKSLLISKKLNLTDFEKWINNELNGYDSVEEIPNYRIVRGDIKAFNPYNGIWMPIYFEDSEEAEQLSSRKISQKITELEKLTVKEKHQLHVPFSKELEAKLVKRLKVPSTPVLIIPNTSVFGIIESVRNIILDWTLKLEEQGILGDGIKFSEEEKTTALTSNQINITNFQGFIGNITNSSIIQKNKLEVRKNDIESLKKYLINELEIPVSDVDELEEAIKKDDIPKEKDKFGKNVSNWIGKAISKVASGTLNLAISTAANVLGTAISKYYGL